MEASTSNHLFQPAKWKVIKIIYWLQAEMWQTRCQIWIRLMICSKLNYTVDDGVIIPVEYIAVRDTRRRQASGCNKISSQNTVRMWCENLHNRVIQGWVIPEINIGANLVTSHLSSAWFVVRKIYFRLFSNDHSKPYYYASLMYT